MGMSTYVIGIVPADAKFLKMKMIWELCEENDVEIPDEVVDFFNNERPDDKGVRIHLEDNVAVSNYNEDASSGFEVEIDKLPKDVKIIRFYNSW